MAKKKEMRAAASAWTARAAGWLKEHRKQIVEQGKTLLILLLFCSACVLAGKTGVLNGNGLSSVRAEFMNWLDRGGTGTHNTDVREYAAGARPQVMAVLPEAGTRYGAMYSGDVDTLYARFSTYLGEALGTAGTPEAVSRETWENALSRCGVYFDFIEPESLVCLAAWQGTEGPESAAEHWARRLFLSVEEQGGWLYYLSEEDGVIYRCATAIDQSAALSRMAVYQPNGAYFAFEREENAGLDPDVMILPGSTEVRVVSVTGLGLPEAPETLMRRFGMNDITATSYLEASGTTVYLDGDSTLRLAGDGTVSFERGQDRSEAGTFPLGLEGLPETVDTLYRMVMELMGTAATDGELRLVSADYDARRDAQTVRFAWFLDGMQVCAPGGVAAEFTVARGELVQARICLRQYQFTGETQTPLPPVQAAALAVVSGGTELERVYQDTGDRVTVSWRIG